MIKKLIFFILLLFIGTAYKSYAQVQAVADFVNMPHNVLTGVNTLQSITEATKQYKLLMDEYKMMVQNMAAPYFWVFNEVKNFDKNIDRYKEQYKKYGDKAAWEEHFASLLDPDTYANSPCYKFGGCSPEENARLAKQREFALKNAAEVSRNFVNRFNELSDEYKKRLGIVEKVSKNSEQADGQIKAIGASNEYLHVLNSSIIELSAKMDTFLEAYNAMNLIELEKHRRRDAMLNSNINNKVTIKVPTDNRLYFTDIEGSLW